MRIRIYNANILTMQPGQRMFCGEVHIQDDKIVYLGTEDGAPSLQWDRQINAGGNVVMPGFKDAHTHSAMTFCALMQMICHYRSGCMIVCSRWRIS